MAKAEPKGARWVTLFVWTWTALAWGCAHAPASYATDPAIHGIHGRHFDQVCHPSGRAPTEVRLAEVLDTAGLVAEVRRVGVQPLPLTPPWPLYDFVILYGADGRPSAMGTWDATVEPRVAASLEEAMRRRVRSLPRLLETTGYRTQVVFAPRVSVQLAAPSECMPHMAHPPGGRPYGLAQDVTTWGAAGYRGRGDDRAAVVRIRVGRDGAVVAVDSLGGDADMVARARAQVALLRFDPALRNGVPVEGELVQGFRFRVVEPGQGDPGSGSTATRWSAPGRSPGRRP